MADEKRHSPAQQIALWADELRDHTAMGLRFADNIYERARYAAIQKLAMAMLAFATETPLEDMEALRAPIFSRPTPISVGDAAVIVEWGHSVGRILLIRRADNGLWAMPGGALEVGETPAEGVMREVFEETGVRCAAVALVGVFDSRYCDTPSRHQLYHFVFLARPLDGVMPEPPSHALEVLDVAWFAEDALPDAIDPGHVDRILYAFRVWHGEVGAYFDRS